MLAGLGPASLGRAAALDLGAGFGMHSIPLARMGYEVTAVDSSAHLLATLSDHAAGLAIRTVESDLMRFVEHCKAPLDLILCMGDTLTHLLDVEVVANLFAAACRLLKSGGRMVLTYRDYTGDPIAALRFVPIRGDADRILTCCLETTPSHLVVHDLLHERAGAVWKTSASSYRKIRLRPLWVTEILQSLGFEVHCDADARGMIRVTAAKP